MKSEQVTGEAVIVDVFHNIVILKRLVTWKGGLGDITLHPSFQWEKACLDRSQGPARSASAQRWVGQHTAAMWDDSGNLLLTSHGLFPCISRSQHLHCIWVTVAAVCSPQLHGVGPFRRLFGHQGLVDTMKILPVRFVDVCQPGAVDKADHVVVATSFTSLAGLIQKTSKNHIGNMVLTESGLLYRLFHWIITGSSPFSTVQLAVLDRFWSILCSYPISKSARTEGAEAW